MGGTGMIAMPLALRRGIAAEVLSEEPDTALRAAIARLAALCRDSLEAVVFFGSRRTGAASADRWSAYDLLAVVSGYRPFFSALHAGGLVSRRPHWLAALGHWLPPTQVSLRFGAPELHAKVSVIRTDRFLRETSSRRRDHFMAGRLFQPSRLEYARTAEVRETLLDGLISAYRETWRWVRPWLPVQFDAAAYGRTALTMSMAWEIRPEPAGRAAALWDAQAAAQTPLLEALLEELESQGRVRARGTVPCSWEVVARASRTERLRVRLYFCRSLVRSTARWLKHMLTFEGWLDYIVRKASRHTGERIELTRRERAWPLVFLWGRVFRYLRHKNRKGVRS